MRKYFPIYEEAVSHKRLCNWSIQNLLYEDNLIFFFISEVGSCDSFPHKNVDLHRLPGPFCQLAEVFAPEIVAS